MNAAVYEDIVAKEEGKRIVPTWGTKWNGFEGDWNYVTAEEQRKIENDCESAGGTAQQINACIAAKLATPSKGEKIGQALSSGLDLFNQWQANKGTNTTTFIPQPERNRTGMYVALGLGAVALGVAVWYFGFKKK